MMGRKEGRVDAKSVKKKIKKNEKLLASTRSRC
jgi:hypothetical protein